MTGAQITKYLGRTAVLAFIVGCTDTVPISAECERFSPGGAEDTFACLVYVKAPTGATITALGREVTVSEEGPTTVLIPYDAIPIGESNVELRLHHKRGLR